MFTYVKKFLLAQKNNQLLPQRINVTLKLTAVVAVMWQVKQLNIRYCSTLSFRCLLFSLFIILVTVVCILQACSPVSTKNSISTCMIKAVCVVCTGEVIIDGPSVLFTYLVMLGDDLTGARTAQGIVDSAMSNLRSMVSERLTGKSGGGGGGGQSSGGKQRAV